jgi:cytidylate kinase
MTDPLVPHPPGPAARVDPGPGSASSASPRLVVAVDGPGSSGKSSVGAAAAKRVGYRFCDTGLLYRALTWLALREGVPLDAADRLVPLVDRIELSPDEDGRLVRVFVDGDEVTDLVRTAGVDAQVSQVARVPAVRQALLQSQRRLAVGGGIVMAGRDIGTVVLPDADLKLYLDASVEARARRRAMERGLDPGGAAAGEILEQLRQRDLVDSTRPVAPLALAPDAVRVVTDDLDFEQTVERVVAAIQEAVRSGRLSAGQAAPDGSSRGPAGGDAP